MSRASEDNLRSHASFSPSYHRWLAKRWGERLLALTGLVVLSPLLALLALMVRLTSPGRAFYWQERSGLRGRPFQILKLRTMFQDAEQWTGAVWALEDDPRVTPVGNLLRKLHLDELPQLWNIARGEMALVGPRPERPSIVDELAEEIPGYRWRLAVLPGVTGLAQVNLPPDQTHDCVRRKLELDLEYVFTAEPWMDVRIVACTVLKMLGIPRKLATRLLGLYRDPETGVPFAATSGRASGEIELSTGSLVPHGRHRAKNLAEVEVGPLVGVSKSPERLSSDPLSAISAGR